MTRTATADETKAPRLRRGAFLLRGKGILPKPIVKLPLSVRAELVG